MVADPARGVVLNLTSAIIQPLLRNLLHLIYLPLLHSPLQPDLTGNVMRRGTSDRYNNILIRDEHEKARCCFQQKYKTFDDRLPS